MPPDPPTIQGAIAGEAGTEYDYTICAVDPNNHQVYFYIDWGDGTIDEWIGPYASEEEIIRSHTWDERDTYLIQVKAKDIKDAESEWTTLEVTMPENSQGQYQGRHFSVQRIRSVISFVRELI